MEEECYTIQENLKELYSVIHQCQDERNSSEHNLANIRKTHGQMQHEVKMSIFHKRKLKGLYNTAMQDCDSEGALLKRALDIINDIRTIRNEKRLAAKNAVHPKESIPQGVLMMMLQQSGMTLPLWVGKRKEPAPPLCGSIPAETNYIAKVGDMVAAFLKVLDGKENWILAEVSRYNHSSSQYEVEDIDDQQKKEKCIVSRRHVIPLPLTRANPLTNPEALFTRDTLVLALFPQSTCFYRAIIKDPPSKPQEDYQVLFEDTNYDNGYAPPLGVCQRYVIDHKELY